MQQKTPADCPRCGRHLQNFNGHIGYCSQHKWISPAGLGFEAEAADQNRLDAEAENKRRLEAERQQAEAKAQEARKRGQSTVRKAIFAVVALCAVAALVVSFVIRPSVNYDSATAKLQAGDYAAAREAFVSLGSYKDAPSRALLSEAMLDLDEGRTSDAADKLERLTADGAGDAASTLADALLPVVSGWKSHGLSADSLLLLLEKMPVIDPNNTLDVEALRVEGHTALLSQDVLASYADDVNGDGETELAALNSDHTVTVYRMSADGNARISVANAVAAACAMRFGADAILTDIDRAVACFEEAYRLSPATDTRAALADAYRKRAAAYENAGDMPLALRDAQSALGVSGASSEFDFLYELSLRNCQYGHDTVTAIGMWEGFAQDHAEELRRFGAAERWKADAGQLHIDHAASLAAKKSAACMAELTTASALGVDVSAAVDEAMTHFEEGLTLTNLRLIAIELAQGDAPRQQALKKEAAQGLVTALSDWRALGIAPADVPAMIRIADEQHVALAGIDRDSVYREAAMAATGQVSQSDFVNWDDDAYQELLTISPDGTLALYGIGDGWTVISSIDTGLANPAYAIVEENAPIILVTPADNSALLVATCVETALRTVFRETGISRYARNGTDVTFSRQLEGSIARFDDYAYSAADASSRPVRTGIDWQRNDYPQPESASAALRRYFEACAYGIADEMAALASESPVPGIFSLERLAALPAPDVPGTISADAYQTEDERMLFEVTYPSGAQSIRAWVAVEYAGGWRVVGAADTYGADLPTDGIDFSIPLICLNVEAAHTMAAKGERDTYRLLIPSAGRVGLLWQSGDKVSSRTAYSVTMVRGALTGDVVFSYDLQPSPNKQKSKDIFLAAGVYYVTVEAKTADAAPYHLTMTMEAQSHVELENNDVYLYATPVELNTGYSASLSSATDVDYFSFVLDETGAVNAMISASGAGGKPAVYVVTVLSASDGAALSSFTVPGNAQLAESGNLYLSSGAYYVKVAKGSAFTNDEYILTVNVTRDGGMESEPNNTMETATTIPVNEDIRASIGQEGDVDCYAFTLTGDAVIQPKLSFAPTDSSARTYVLTIMDANRRELLKANIGGKEYAKVIAPVALAAGRYTVKIENPRFVRQDYTLRLVSVAADAAEKEPNDSEALATPLPLGSAHTGVLTSREDVDCYRLTFDEQTTVTLKFSFAQSTSQDTVFVLTVEQNGKTQWTANIKGDSGGMEKQLQFPAGEYYIRVRPSTWLSAVYTIAID